MTGQLDLFPPAPPPAARPSAPSPDPLFPNRTQAWVELLRRAVFRDLTIRVGIGWMPHVFETLVCPQLGGRFLTTKGEITEFWGIAHRPTWVAFLTPEAALRLHAAKPLVEEAQPHRYACRDSLDFRFARGTREAQEHGSSVSARLQEIAR